MPIRRARPEDAMAVARVHVRSWQAAYRGLMPDQYLDGLRAENRAATYDFSGTDPLKPETIVMEDAGSIVGFATTAPSDVIGWGELSALYVDPDHWARGFGVALIAAARMRLVERGFGEAVLWVLEGNTRADRFYRNDGWMHDETRRTTTVWGITVNENRYRRLIA